jgi:hypothetical protein
MEAYKMKYLMDSSPFEMTIELIKNMNKEEYVEIILKNNEMSMHINLYKENTIELRDLLTELINKMKVGKEQK